MLNKYNKYVVIGSIDSGISSLVFKVAHFMISRLDVLAELDLEFNFSLVLEKYLSRNNNNYNMENNYRELLLHLLNKLPSLKVYLSLIHI